MKNIAERLWEQMKEEADWQEENAKKLVWDVPADAKSPQELYEELMERIRNQERTQRTF